LVEDDSGGATGVVLIPRQRRRTMTDSGAGSRRSGGAKILRGFLIAVVIVAAIILLAVYWRQVLDALTNGWNYLGDHFPGQTGQKVAVIVYLLFAILFGFLFSKAGHFTAYGLAMGLGPLLWALFWEGFPPLGLNPSWTTSLGLNHLGPNQVILWAVVGAAIITLVFVPLEIREKMKRRTGDLISD
jgi:hypothetical protein